MKKQFIILLIFCIAFTIACNTPKQPEFVEMQGVKVSSFSLNKITLTGDAKFSNPNAYGIQLTDVDLDVAIDGEKVGNVQQTKDIKVPASQNFLVPIVVDIAPKDLSFDLLGSALTLIGGSKKVKVNYKGSITVEAMNVPLKIPVNSTEEISLTE